MKYNEVLAYLYSSLPVFHRIGPAALKPGLQNTRELLSHLGNPEQNFKAIHVAGTNGKGSSSHMLSAILQSAGYKTGLYTSPHLKNFTERIKINGKEVTEDFVVDFVDKHKETIEKIKPSFFEVTVGMAFEYFSQQQVDIAIIETGLGGRLDSTNVILPIISLITNISYDHQAILGDTLSQIAMEKAGIIKENIPVVISETQQEVESVFFNMAQSKASPIIFADQEFVVEELQTISHDLQLNITLKGKPYLLGLNLSLGGKYQLKNIAGVLAVVELLKTLNFTIEEQNIRAALAAIKEFTGLKGRWQVIKNRPLTICDTGHNIAGIKFIVEQIQKIKYKKLFWVFGVVNDKDINPILSILPQEAHYIFCQAYIPRAMDAITLSNHAASAGLTGHVINDVNAAYAWAMQHAKEDDLILIGGSTFVVAELNDL